jgi:integrase
MARRNEGPRLKWHRYGAAYYICWTENGRSRERSTGTADREQAEIVFAEWMQVRGRKHGPSDPAKTLITDALTDYANERGPKVAAPRVIGCAIDALAGFWQGRKIVEVTPLTCSQYGDWRCRSENTVRRELAVLQAAINWGFKNGKLTRPVAVTLPAKPESRKRWLTKQEAARLLRASRTEKARLYLPLFILLGLYTGRRKEAILSLRWPQVDLERGLIDFEIPGRQRTKKQRGAVPLNSKLLPHLKRARRRGTDVGYVLHINGISIGDIKKGFAAACERAGLDDVTPHTLRHTAATWLMQSGVKTWEAAGFLAMSEKMLIEVYGHHHPDHMREAAEALGRKPFRRISA